MGTKHLLGIDIGTSSVKVALIDMDGNLVGNAAKTYRLIQDGPGYQQMDAEDMWRAVLGCVREISKKVSLSLVVGIGISCLCPGLTAFDRDGLVLINPILYSDQRSMAEAEQIKEKIGEEELFAITANHVMAGAMSGTSMLWVKRHCPDIYQKIYCFGHVNTLLAVRMTGKFAMDYSNASYTTLFETTGGYQWSEKLCEGIGIEMEKLPPLIKSYEVVGELLCEELIETGLPKGTPVVIGGGDTACASLATGVIHHGDVCESVGTTNVLTVCVTEPKFHPGFINRCHVIDDAWIYQGALSHTGASLRWMKDCFCTDIKAAAEAFHSNAYDLMTETAALHSVPGAHGIVFLPYMQGERSPVWDSYARGVFFGMSLQSKRDDFIRAVLEGAAYGLLQLCKLAEEVTGREITEFCAVGGGAKSAVWSQIKADVTGKDISVLDVNDMAPIGAALLAGMGVGVFRDAEDAQKKVKKAIYRRFVSRKEDEKIYQKRYQTYIKLDPQLKELYRENY